MKFDLQQAMEVLERTPGVLKAMLSGLSDNWVQGNYGEDTFSPYDVIGHLITGEKTDWMVRARIILDHGTSKPFAKYDRYAQFEESAGKSLEQLLDEFARLRAANLSALRDLRLSPNDLTKRGMHPALDAVELLAAAESGTGLSDWGDPSFRERFAHAVELIRGARMDAEGAARLRAMELRGGAASLHKT